MPDFELCEAIEILARTPGTLTALLGGLPDRWIRPNEGPDTFSAFDVVGHLLHGERADWIARARTILEHGESRTFEPFDRFAQREASRGKALTDLLEEFAALRGGNLAVLRSWELRPEQLDLRGRHPELGAVTLRQHLATWVVHDLGHIGQIVRVMAKQYQDEVGPWREYLPVLHR